MPAPSSYQRRRRAGASASSHVSTGRPALDQRLELLGHGDELGADDPVRETADRIDEGAEVDARRCAASGCRLEPIARCEGSSTRRCVSPLERNSVLYVRW